MVSPAHRCSAQGGVASPMRAKVGNARFPSTESLKEKPSAVRSTERNHARDAAARHVCRDPGDTRRKGPRRCAGASELTPYFRALTLPLQKQGIEGRRGS